MSATTADREALRQQMLLRALWRDARPGVAAGWMRDGERFTRGLAAYQANAGALAERALGAAFPTVAQLVGEASFAALARTFWHRAPPERGDVATWGAALADFIAGDAQLADEPYLADVARLDWAVHLAGSAADDDQAPSGLDALATHPPEQLRLRLRAGSALVASAHPVVAIWQAHRSGPGDDPERFAGVQAAFAEGRGENALVVRAGWRVQVHALSAPDARFAAALLDAPPLALALKEAGAGFDFGSWLLGALRAGWIGGAEVRVAEGDAAAPAAMSRFSGR